MGRNGENKAEWLERRLAVEILRGGYAVGSRLPPVRELAGMFAVNPSTVQRALARLEVGGLVTARRGSGVRVNDPAIDGDISLVPAWLEALSVRPPEAARVLAEFLEVRRLLACRLLVRHQDRLYEHGDELMKGAQVFVEASEVGGDTLRDADLAFARTLLRCTGNRIALAVLNTAAKVITNVPHVAAAMYGDPAANRASMDTVMAALGTLRGDALANAIEGALEIVDQGTVDRYEEALHAAGRGEG
jgi:DNA-binding FadR family transcriptional regulator